ncbi:MAG TPA: 23S rRNA (guanosine(2251)-2'-O)-methyltransferase RlmB [Rubrobacteraceae bacterium]|nr:23S rRNA (guanosine(2251)-2'-O)-methyltransferase RlmB [Rubrobacteraceae bacterium]
MRGEVIYGIRPVAEALRSKRREVYEVLDAVGDEVVASAADSRRVRLKRVKREHIEQLAPGTVHQGVAARVRPYPYSGLAEILTMLPDPLVVLDGVTDPRNLGAVLRVADGAGASGVVVPRHQAVGVTPTVVKASAGASEHVRVARETNLRRALDEIKKAGVWTYAAEGGAAQAYTDLDLSGPVAFVLGSEGRGIRRLVREGCDEAISIEMHGVVSSLNVSVAAAILLFETRRQQGCRGT